MRKNAPRSASPTLLGAAATGALLLYVATAPIGGCLQQVLPLPDAGSPDARDSGSPGDAGPEGTLTWRDLGIPSNTGICALTGVPDSDNVWAVSRTGDVFAYSGGGWIQVYRSLWSSGSVKRCGAYVTPSGALFVGAAESLGSCPQDCASDPAAFTVTNAADSFDASVSSLCGQEDKVAATGNRPTGGFVATSDGGPWSEVPRIPDSIFRGCWMQPNGDIFVAASTAVMSVIGSAHTDEAVPDGGITQLEATWGTGSEIYAVGGGFNEDGRAIVVRRADGGWEESYRSATEGGRFRSLWGTGPREIYAGAPADGGRNALAFFNGSRWTYVETPGMGPIDLQALWAARARDYYAGGLCTTDAGTVGCVFRGRRFVP